MLAPRCSTRRWHTSCNVSGEAPAVARIYANVSCDRHGAQAGLHLKSSTESQRMTGTTHDLWIAMNQAEEIGEMGTATKLARQILSSDPDAPEALDASYYLQCTTRHDALRIESLALLKT